MSTWKKYKQTFREEADIFDLARQGDIRELANMLSKHAKSELELDINTQNHRGYSALMLAVYNGEKDFCEALLRFGSDVNSRDFTGNTVLMAAAFKGDIGILKLLLEYGAETKLINKSNMTVRDWALMFGRKNIIQFLDTAYPEKITSSKFKSILRFLRLGVLIFKGKYSRENKHKTA